MKHVLWQAPDNDLVCNTMTTQCTIALYLNLKVQQTVEVYVVVSGLNEEHDRKYDGT